MTERKERKQSEGPKKYHYKSEASKRALAYEIADLNNQISRVRSAAQAAKLHREADEFRSCLERIKELNQQIAALQKELNEI